MPDHQKKELIPGWVTPLAVASAALILFLGESRRPLRSRREPRGVRVGRNMSMLGLSAAATSLLQSLLLAPIVPRVEKSRLGLLNQLPLSRTVKTIAGVLLLDYTLWWWHWINHKVPFFWRFHLVHHVDRDLDSSTAIRFHFGEMSLSVLFRMAQIRFLGVDSRAISIWQGLLMVSILFHHSNLRIPVSVERLLVRFVVTPRMHGIHHSQYRDETGTNWSSLLSWWDYLHGTLRLDIPQREITIGVPGYDRPEDVTLPKVVAMPFVEQRDDWIDPDGVPKFSRPLVFADTPKTLLP